MQVIREHQTNCVRHKLYLQQYVTAYKTFVYRARFSIATVCGIVVWQQCLWLYMFSWLRDARGQRTRHSGKPNGPQLYTMPLRVCSRAAAVFLCVTPTSHSTHYCRQNMTFKKRLCSERQVLCESTAHPPSYSHHMRCTFAQYLPRHYIVNLSRLFSTDSRHSQIYKSNMNRLSTPLQLCFEIISGAFRM